MSRPPCTGADHDELAYRGSGYSGTVRCGIRALWQWREKESRKGRSPSVSRLAEWELLKAAAKLLREAFLTMDIFPCAAVRHSTAAQAALRRLNQGGQFRSPLEPTDHARANAPRGCGARPIRERTAEPIQAPAKRLRCS